MKVHNLIYYVQETSLVKSGKPIIDEQFEDWVHGPVLSSLRGLFVFLLKIIIVEILLVIWKCRLSSTQSISMVNMQLGL